MYTQLHPDKVAAVQKAIGKKRKKPKPQQGSLLAKLAERVYNERLNA